MLPSVSSVRPCGEDFGVFTLYSLNCSVLGSNRPITLPTRPEYHTEPSLAYSGSCGKVPPLGRFHSLMDTSTLPGISTGFGALLGKLFARYADAIGICSFVRG